MPSFIDDTTQPQKKQLLLWIVGLTSATLLLLGIILLSLIINSLQEIFPEQTQIEGVDVSLLKKDEAKVKLETSLKNNGQFEIQLQIEDKTYATTSSALEFEQKITDSVENAFNLTHENLKITKPIRLFNTLMSIKSFSVEKNFSQIGLESFIAMVAQKTDDPGHEPFAKMTNGHDPKSLKVDPGKIGLELNQEQLYHDFALAIKTKTQPHNILITTKPELVHKELSQTELNEAKERATKFSQSTIRLSSESYKDVYLEIRPESLVTLLSFPIGINQEQLNKFVMDLAGKINRPSQDAVFEYSKLDNGQYKIDKFQPHQDGLELDIADTKEKIVGYINKIDQSNQDEVETDFSDTLILKTIQPTLTLEKLNDLGIKELIGFGDSYYEHSIPNRVWNVALTAEKIDLTLIPPGAEFSFNKNLGEVSRRTGYRSAYVISGGKTVLGDGGGVCQVSTTLFRAALNAGLNITKRKAHSYRVSYYELNQKPGIDATVYSGDVDLRFINDTPGYILMKTMTDSENLYMKIELYGTSDGRKSEIANHKTWDLRGPPAPVYYPTTEIPKGKLQQVDWSVSGIKASFDYIVKDKDGQIIRQENYYSNYVPWSAKYLQGV